MQVAAVLTAMKLTLKNAKPAAFFIIRIHLEFAYQSPSSLTVQPLLGQLMFVKLVFQSIISSMDHVFRSPMLIIVIVLREF